MEEDTLVRDENWKDSNEIKSKGELQFYNIAKVVMLMSKLKKELH